MQSIKESAELWASRRFFIELWNAPTFVLLAFRLRSVFEGIRDANKIISEGLTPQIIQYKTIEAYRELSKSPNTKVIVGGGKDFILNP